MGTVLENKLEQSKYVNIKYWSPKLISLKKKLSKDQPNIWHKKWKIKMWFLDNLGNRYEEDMTTIFYPWSKLYFSLDAQPEFQILSGLWWWRKCFGQSNFFLPTQTLCK